MQTHIYIAKDGLTGESDVSEGIKGIHTIGNVDIQILNSDSRLIATIQINEIGKGLRFSSSMIESVEVSHGTFSGLQFKDATEPLKTITATISAKP